ncbi:MAG TPA: hypothetical protein PKE27_22730, partial [Povalibacter sp.]|uniref:hypothetical protein n=1 Tax=Povalibacter sp. TaxID=1962978 RepID=UPI002BB150BF
MRRLTCAGLWLAALVASAASGANSESVRRDHVTVQLVAADRVAQPGATTLVGLRIVHDPEWHTYWRNPG